MTSFPVRILAVSIPGLLAGLFFNATRTMGFTSGALNLVVTTRYVLSQLIAFLAPLIIIGLMASSIISVKKDPTPATKPVIRITYISMLGAAAFSAVLGYLIIPRLPVSTDSLSFRSYSGEKPWKVLKEYLPVCKMALMTRSSAATGKYSLEAASKCECLEQDLTKDALPLFTQIHHCGSVLTEVFFAMMISRILYGSVPAPGTMVIFSVLLATCSIGTPGLPWGTVMVSLGTLTGILKFGDSGVALMFAVFAIHDGFAAACNMTCDGALALILTGYAKKREISKNTDI